MEYRRRQRLPILVSQCRSPSRIRYVAIAFFMRPAAPCVWFVRGRLPRQWLLIGEAPGALEDELGRPFPSLLAPVFSTARTPLSAQLSVTPGSLVDSDMWATWKQVGQAAHRAL